MENFTLKELEALYETLTPKDGEVDKCAYCGTVATEVEHVIPRTFFHNDKKKHLGFHAKRNNLVMSCRECNGLAGTKLFDNFWEKKKFIAEQVERRHKKLLNMAEWRPEEVDELKGLLKRYVFTAIKVKEKIKERLINLNSPQIFE